MNPSILKAIQLREEAGENCRLANERRSLANEAYSVAEAGVYRAVQDVLRAAFPGVEPLTASVYVEHDKDALSVVFIEPRGGDAMPPWEVELVELGEGWVNRRTRYGHDPVRLVEWALESVHPDRAEVFYRALGLVQFGSVTVGGVTVAAHGENVVDLVKNLAAAVRDQAGVPAHAEGSTVCIDLSTSGRSGTFAVVESGKPES